MHVAEHSATLAPRDYVKLLLTPEQFQERNCSLFDCLVKECGQGRFDELLLKALRYATEYITQCLNRGPLLACPRTQCLRCLDYRTCACGTPKAYARHWPVLWVFAGQVAPSNSEYNTEPWDALAGTFEGDVAFWAGYRRPDQTAQSIRDAFRQLPGRLPVLDYYADGRPKYAELYDELNIPELPEPVACVAHKIAVHKLIGSLTSNIQAGVCQEYNFDLEPYGFFHGGESGEYLRVNRKFLQECLLELQPYKH